MSHKCLKFSESLTSRACAFKSVRSLRIVECRPSFCWVYFYPSFMAVYSSRCDVIILNVKDVPTKANGKANG